VGELHRLRTGQVGDGARHLQAAVDAASRPAQARGRRVQEFRRRVVELALRINGFALQRLVAAALPRDGAFACSNHPLPDAGRAFARCGAQQFLGGQRSHFHMQINPVQQRAAEFALVTRNLVGRATAGTQTGAEVAAGAGVHGSDQLEAGRKLGALGGAGDRDGAGLQRFAQGFQRGTREFGEFIEE